RLEMGKMEIEKMGSETIPVMVLRYPVELSLGRVAAWKYKRLYFIICSDHNLGIIIEVEYVLKERIKSLKNILKSIRWKKSIKGLDDEKQE
ncbi:MAG: hypothetical protein JW827_02030, partial [Spirochaetes bacterium]|nr:hypothetical protein [Spirochaetota bacterium]